MGVFRRPFQIRRRRAPVSSAPAGAGQTLTGVYISPTTTLYSGTVHRGTIRIVYASAGESDGTETAFSIPLTVPVSDNLGFMLVIYGEDSLAPVHMIVYVGSGGSVAARNSLPNMSVYFGHLPSGESELHIALRGGGHFCAWGVIVFDGVDVDHLDTVAGDEATAASEIALNDTYATNSMYFGASWGWDDGGDFTQAALADVFTLESLASYPGLSSYHLSLLALPISGAVTADFGVTNTPAADDERTIGYYIKGIQGALTGAYIDPTTALYAGVITHVGQTLYGAYISPTTALYAGTVKQVLTGAYISPTTSLYAGTIAVIPGVTQYLVGTFIGMGQPSVVNGAYISPATALYAGVVTSAVTISGTSAYIDATIVLFAGVLVQHANPATGQIWAGTIAHV